MSSRGDIAVYRKTKPSTGYVGYEVVKITLRPLHPFDPDKELYDRVEHYPSSAEWGTWQREAAINAFDEKLAKLGYHRDSARPMRSTAGAIETRI